ncbi:arylsulfatase [Flavobacterium flevense]|uniref:Arylsulfatase n=2 Tax=Flavobacterium flevense TaxID=983 RepID=A0A4Y4B035_9FLAO|nr:arylsulfatase [Flavobacterium flevense]
MIFFIATDSAAQKKPNIIVVLADDMGFSDIGCYGGEAKTPNLDALATEGMRFSQFYNGARCCPTRASLLTGLYAQQAGVGYMTGKLGATEEYQGHIKNEVATLGDLMKDQGYTTLHVGKWHVGNIKNKTMPKDKGFERSWTTEGTVDYWNVTKAYEDGVSKTIDKSKSNFLTDIQGDKAIEYLDYSKTKDKPFFMYLAFNASHWPLHAKEEDIAKYQGKFLKGWEVLKKERIRKIDSIGLVKAISDKKLIDAEVPKWADYPAGDKFKGYNAVTSDKHDQADWDRQMAVYAAQIDNMDQNLGRIIAHLKAIGEYENTIIMYLQDNGACAESIGKNDENLPGTAESYIAYGLPWANLSNTPFRMYKHFVHEGGISTPFIINWPAQMNKKMKGSIEKNISGHLIDIVPTCLDAAGVATAKLNSLEGISLLPLAKGQDVKKRTLFWEHEGNRAIREGDWKLVSRYVDDHRFFKSWGWTKAPRKKEWELYNIADDRWELNDLSAQNPQKVNEMIKEYEQWFKRVGAIDRKELIEGSKEKF